MFNLLATSYEYTNGNCYVDGVLQSTTEQCTDITNTVGAFFGLGVAFIFLMIFLIIIWLVFFVFWVIQLIHVIQHQDIKDRTMWIVLLFAAFFLGFIWLIVPIYYFVVMRNYKKQQPVNQTSNSPEPIAQQPNDSSVKPN